MEILRTDKFVDMLLEMASQKTLAQRIDDFFDMISQIKKSTFVSVYTVNTMDDKLAAVITDIDGNRIRNNLYGKLYTATRYTFKFGHTYKELVRRKNPNHDLQRRNDGSSKVSGYTMVEFNRNGELVFPVIGFTKLTKYFMLQDDGYVKELSKAEVSMYCQPSKLNDRQPASGVNYRPIKVDKIFLFNGAHKTFPNPNFIYPFIIDRSKIIPLDGNWKSVDRVIPPENATAPIP